LGVGALLSLISFSCKGSGSSSKLEIDGGGGFVVPLGRRGSLTEERKKERNTVQHGGFRGGEKKEKERIGIVLFCCIMRFGGRVKSEKNCLIKAYF
jgi:hypothetical protein